VTCVKAIVCTRYGPPEVLSLEDVEKPAPIDNAVVVRVHATTVTAGDLEIRKFKFPLWLWLPARIGFGIRRPRSKILGQELAGEVEAVGKEASLFRQGDRVFGTTGFGFGAYAEYICLPENPRGGVLAIMPAGVTYEEAVVLSLGGLEALHFLRKGNVRKGEKVLINGAGGSIGTLAVQLAKLFGAEVTAVDSTGKLDMLCSIGADHVIDYTREDFTRNGETYDVIFDVVGKSPYSRSLRSLKQNGRYLLANPGLSQIIRGVWTSLISSRKVIFGAAPYRAEDLIFLEELVEAGKIRPVIDRSFPLERIVEAHEYAEKGHKKGNIVITVGEETGSAARISRRAEGNMG